MAVTDPIHQHVEHFLAAHPEYQGSVLQQGQGEYIIDHREVKVGFCRQGFLVVHDGPLRQPFVDYVKKKEGTAVYHSSGLRNSALTSVPKDSRISFGDEGNRYSRLDAMKVAKEQALFREKAANYVSEGRSVPAELMQKYEKTIDVKLGNNRLRAPKAAKATPEQLAPAWWPGKVATPMSARRTQSHAPPVAANAAPMPVTPSHMPPMAQQPNGQATPNIFGQMPNLLGAVASPMASPMAGGRPSRLSMVAPPGSPIPVVATRATPAAPAIPRIASQSIKSAAPMSLKAPLAGYPTVPMRGRLCGA